MQYHNYNPLVYRSFGANDPTSILSNVGSQYGYEGQYDPNKYPQLGSRYVINNQVFRSQNDYNAFNNYLASRSSFLEQQARDNPEAYGEYAKSPYAFQGNSPFKSAAQKAAEQEAARVAAQSAAQGGQSKPVGTTPSTTVGLTGAATPIAGRTVPANVGLTDIPKNNNALMLELRKLLGDIPGLFNVEGITKGFKTRIANDEAFGRQAASNAGAEFAARTRAEGGDASLAGLISAQAMLPVLQHSGELESQLADKQLAARQGRGSLTATVAEALANLRTNYLKGLVDYTGKIQDIQSANQQNTQRLNEQSREFDLGHAVDVGRLTLQQKQQDEQEKQNKLQSILAAAQLSDKKVDPNKSTYYPGITPGGPIDPIKQQRNDSLDRLIAQLGL